MDNYYTKKICIEEQQAIWRFERKTFRRKCLWALEGLVAFALCALMVRCL